MKKVLLLALVSAMTLSTFAADKGKPKGKKNKAQKCCTTTCCDKTNCAPKPGCCKM